MTMKKLILAAGLLATTITPASAWIQDGGYFAPENPPMDVSTDAPYWAWFTVESSDLVSRAVTQFTDAAKLNYTWAQMEPIIESYNRHYGENANFDADTINPGERVLLPVYATVSPQQAAANAAAAREAAAAKAQRDQQIADSEQQLAAAGISDPSVQRLGALTQMGFIEHQSQINGVKGTVDTLIGEVTDHHAMVDQWAGRVEERLLVLDNLPDDLDTFQTEVRDYRADQAAPFTDQVDEVADRLAPTINVDPDTVTIWWQKGWQVPLALAACLGLMLVFRVLGFGRRAFRYVQQSLLYWCGLGNRPTPVSVNSRLDRLERQVNDPKNGLAATHSLARDAFRVAKDAAEIAQIVQQTALEYISWDTNNPSLDDLAALGPQDQPKYWHCTLDGNRYQIRFWRSADTPTDCAQTNLQRNVVSGQLADPIKLDNKLALKIAKAILTGRLPPHDPKEVRAELALIEYRGAA